MTLSNQQRDITRLKDILTAIDDMDRVIREPQRDFITQKALERCFTILGESCRRVSPDIKKAYPDIPWNQIIGLRNIIVHEYEKVEIETLWDIAEQKVPSLRDWVNGILKDLENVKNSIAHRFSRSASKIEGAAGVP